MIENQRVLAVIPARGGSKRLPRKNVLELAGKPLIGWTIEAAKNSKYVDRVVVSTDDQEIMAVSKQYGADVPFKRPNELASDTATSIDTVLHTLDKLDEQGDHYDYVMLLQPTSPLRSVEDIDGALGQLNERNDDAVISVCETEHSPLWCNTLDENKSMTKFISDELINQRSQDLPTYYRLNGALYVASVSVLRNMGTPSFFLSDKVSAYEMSAESSIDIDNQIDLDIAESQFDKSVIFKARLSDRLLETYTRNGIGKLHKSEIDMVMFDFCIANLLARKRPSFIVSGAVNYALLGTKELYMIAKELRLKEGIVRDKIEELTQFKNIYDMR